MSDCYTRRLDDALALASDAFRSIRRKGSGVPYLSHLLSVAALVAEHGGDEDQIVAALLHDVLEDIRHISADDLEARFGKRVRDYVVALSDTTEHPKPPWEERKRAYLQLLRYKGADLKLISAADKLHNASTMVRDYAVVGDALWDRFTATREQTLWYYREVHAALSHDFDHAIVHELHATVRRLHELAGESLE
ncbi:MAG: HD domain-containing protein [Polyangiaceae bacterium]